MGTTWVHPICQSLDSALKKAVPLGFHYTVPTVHWKHEFANEASSLPQRFIVERITARRPLPTTTGPTETGEYVRRREIGFSALSRNTPFRGPRVITEILRQAICSTRDDLPNGGTFGDNRQAKPVAVPRRPHDTAPMVASASQIPELLSRRNRPCMTTHVLAGVFFVLVPPLL